MAPLGQSNVERVKEKMDIVSVVSGYVTLQKAGALLRARCPFHNEKSPSFTVSPVRQTYHCFGCGEHGDVFTFVQKIEGMDFRESLELLAQKAGVMLEREMRGGAGGAEQFNKDEKETLYTINESAALQYEINLTSHKEIQEYLASRGISEKTVKLFRLGFAEDSWQAGVDALRLKGYKDADIEKIGLALKSEKNTANPYYDRFRSRIMFPLLNAHGKVAGFTGRIWTPAGKIADETAAKYVNSPETVLYHKSSILYGFHIAKHHIRPLNCVLIVEGQMDLLTCHQVGYTNAVAISGTALTEEQVRQLSRLTKNFLLALDSDKAGVDATIKSIARALEFGCDIKVVSFRGKDASEVLQKEGAEAVKECVREAVDWCTYLLSVVEARAEGDTRKRARLINETLVPLVKAVDNPLERDALLNTIHERTALSLESLKESLTLAKIPVAHSASSVTLPQKAPTPISQTLPNRAKPPSSIHLLFAAMDVEDVRSHPHFNEWQTRLLPFSPPELSTEDAHTLLATFPKIEHALHVEEIITELFRRAEKEHFTAELTRVGDLLRSAELAGDEGATERLTAEAGTLHKRLYGLVQN